MPETFTLYDRVYQLADLDSLEMQFFEAGFETLLGTNDSIERMILADRKALVLAAVRAVKAAIPSSPLFRGICPGDMELGFSMIRPVHAKLGAGGIVPVWDFTIVAQTWTDWLCSSTAATGYTLDKRMGQVILYLKSYDTPVPLASEAKFKIGRTEMMPFDLRSLQLLDNKNGVPIFPTPTMFMMPSVDQLYAQLYVDTLNNASTVKTALGGLTIGLGAFLKNTASVTWQT